MSTHNLQRMFHPQRIAVLGASDQPNSAGAVVLRNLIGTGANRVIYPVNPHLESVYGVPTYHQVAALPKRPDLAVICAEPEATAGLVAECGAVGVPGLIIFSTGFREVGEDGRELEEQVRHAARGYPDMRILGPNSHGVIVPHLDLNISLTEGQLKPGRLAFVSQSKSLSASTLDWALKEQVGFSYFVSLGNAMDISFSDLIDYFGGDPQTVALILYLISITDVRNFMSAARAFARSKPIVAYRSGRLAESAEGFSSHTGRMACEDSVYDAAFERAGIVRVRRIEDIFVCAELLARQRTPRGDRLGIVTNASEPSIVAVDALLSRKGKLAALGEQTLEHLAPLRGGGHQGANPVVLPRDAGGDEYREALRGVLQDGDVNAALVIFTPTLGADPTAAAEAVSQLAKESQKPILAAWMGGRSVQAGVQILNGAGVPVYSTPEQAVRAFMYLVHYANNREILYDTPRDVPVSFTPARGRYRQYMREHEQQLLSECRSKELLQSYGIPVTRPQLARTADEAVDIARTIGFPVVLKILSPQITHKTDVQGVAVNLTTEAGVRAHFERIMSSARSQRPDAVIEGVTVQEMVVAPFGIEMILGAKKDRTFGAVIMAGMGGTATEVINDRALGLPPLNERLARRMFESLKSWPLMLGYRGKPRVNIDGLIEIIMRLSYLAADYPEIRELDINPLLVTPDRVIALDASVQVDARLQASATRPFAHLAIRPYPEEYVRSARLKDGTRVVFRPIKPEDEPRWQNLLAECSDESIRMRFRALFQRSSHEVATRYCFVDYDRDMSLVAEVDRNGTADMIGVGNLFSDSNRESAEFAVLVADRWQGLGLGELLTDSCMRIAKTWGLKQVHAETGDHNARMISLFAKHGFALKHWGEEHIVLASKDLQDEA